MTSLEAPIFIPICNSRSTTPTPIPQEDPETPTTFRQRSDTMMTTSSSSSFPHLQTPETPSILGLLHQQYELPGDFSDDGNGRNRKDSYGFGSIIHSAGESSHEKFSREAGSSEMDTEGSDTEEVEGILSTRSTPFDLGQQYDTNDIPLLTSTTAHPSIIPHFSLAEPIQTALPTGQGLPFPPIESIPLRVEGPVAPEYKRSKSSFKSAVRRKLERSKSSFQVLRGRRDEQLNQPLDEDMGEAPGHPGSDAQHLPTALAARPKRGRLRSLLSISMSRSQSSASIRSITSVSSSTTSTSAAVHNGTPSNLSQQMLAIPNDATVVVHEYPGTPSSEEIMSRAIRDNRSRAKGLSMQISADDLAGTIDIPLKDKGKSRARSPFRKSKRPNPFSTATGSPMTKMMPDAPGAPLRISRPRAISMPLEASPLGPVFSLRTPTRRKLDLFGTLLPTEIQVMVLRKLIEGSGEAVGNGRWDGVAGGRRQLVRFSRVSVSPVSSARLNFRRCPNHGNRCAWTDSSGHSFTSLRLRPSCTFRPFVTSLQRLNHS